ncbi:MAG TPA: amidophosphoribosyltransferase [Gammaproteobacteria bacterium]|nr:amidophosphoribosyltransferase [Gammaproteobacteria bacterium]
MCGIVGIVGQSPVNQLLYDALTLLQHRGQDAAGIVTSDGRKFHLRKNNGLVSDVFHASNMVKLTGNMGIGHVRYPTAGCSSAAEAQPFYVNSPYGIAMAHNGNLTNAEDLKAQLYKDDMRHINTESDSEILLNVFAHELQALHKLQVTSEEVFKAVAQVHKRCRGGYAVVATIVGKGVLAFRDPFGIRPACYGKRETDNGVEYMVASESVALHALGFELVRDLQPGEAIYIDIEGNLFHRQCAEKFQNTPCIFEYVYFARPDSIIDDISVYKARLRMGTTLVQKILKERPQHNIDVVIPIPDTSRTSALEVAYHLKVKYREGFIKNRYIGRTFIMPGQMQRKKSVRHKLNAIDLEFKDKNVLLVDDSIVRGTTSRQIIQMAREAGAKNVYMASAAPPVRHPNVYGIDMPSPEEFVADGRDIKEITEEIGADWLIYQDLDDLISAVKQGNDAIESFDSSCFNGEYVTGDVDNAYLQHLQTLRSDSAKDKLEHTDNLAGIDLYSNQ